MAGVLEGDLPLAATRLRPKRKQGFKNLSGSLVLGPPLPPYTHRVVWKRGSPGSGWLVRDVPRKSLYPDVARMSCLVATLGGTKRKSPISLITHTPRR